MNNIDLLIELLKIKTDNPVGVKRAFKFLKNYFDSLNIKNKIIENCFVAYRNKDFDLILNSHIDTVKFQTPIKIEDNKIYGTGSIDAKGNIVLLINTFLNNDNSILVISPDEEKNSSGVYNFCQKFKNKINKEIFCIVGEPTDLNICIGHKGRFEVIVKSRTAPRHSSIPGDNPIEELAKIILDIKNLPLNSIVIDKKYSSSITPTLISGGLESNVIPPEAEVLFDVRSVENDIIKKIKNFLKNYKCEIYLNPNRFYSDFYLLNDKNLIKKLENIGKISFFNATCEAYFFNKFLRAKTIIFGVGKLELAHTKNEFLDLDEFKKGLKKINKIVNLVRE